MRTLFKRISLSPSDNNLMMMVIILLESDKQAQVSLLGTFSGVEVELIAINMILVVTGK